MVSRAEKVQEIEEARRRLLPGMVEDVRSWAWAVLGPGSAPHVLRDAVRVLRGTVYKRDKYDAVKRGAEVVKHPLAVIRQRGADCEDLNVFLLGSVLRSLGVKGLASVYLPNIKAAAHVRLGLETSGERFVGDLVEPGFASRWDGKGEWIAWGE